MGTRPPQTRDARRLLVAVIVAGVSTFVLGGVGDHHVLAAVGLIAAMVAGEVLFWRSRRGPRSAAHRR